MAGFAESQVEGGDDDLGSTRLAWARERWQPLLVGVLAIPVVVAALASGLHWPGRVFPGFFVLTNRIVPTVGLYGWTGPQHGVPFLSQVLTVDGRPVTTPLEVDAIVSAKAEGEPVRYELRVGATQIERTVPTMRFGSVDYWLTFGLFILNGIITTAAGIVVALMQPRTVEARTFLIFSAVFGMVMLSAPPMYDPWLCWLTPLNLAMLAFWGAGFAHLSLVFPVLRPRFAGPGWALAPYLASGALLVWMLAGFYAPVPDLRGIVASWIYIAAAMMLLIGSCAQAYWRDPRPIAHARVRIILPALVFSCSLAFFGQIENAITARFPINLSVMLPVFFYLAVGYSIVRHDLFDIDRIVRQAAIYTGLTLGITGGYALVLGVLGWLPGPQATIGSPVLHLLLIVVAAIAFEPLKQRMQRLVDRMFFRTRVQYRRTVSDVGTMLATLVDVETILGVVGGRLEADVAPSSIRAVLWFGEERSSWTLAAGVATPANTEDLKHLLAPVRSRPVSRAAAERGRDGLRELHDWMVAQGVDLVVPFLVQDRMIGALLLGPRKSGLPYGTSERDLLSTLAMQTAAALQNAALVASNAELSRAYRKLQDTQAQLLQSEKMASLGQLVAGVAHEINTPVTSVVGNVRPLLRELERVREHAAKAGDASLDRVVGRMGAITEVMARGAERTAGIVQDLRVFSRVEEARPLPMDLHEAIDVCLRLLHPRWVDRIEIHRDYGELPPVDAVAGQINQVLMNLLANACDSIEGSGNIWIATRADGEQVRVTIRDDGCGMPPDVQAKAFDPFFTTKPIGKGMGLGLAICAGIVADHDGTIEVASEPGRGTTFTVVLPLQKRPG